MSATVPSVSESACVVLLPFGWCSLPLLLLGGGAFSPRRLWVLASLGSAAFLFFGRK